MKTFFSQTQESTDNLSLPVYGALNIGLKAMANPTEAQRRLGIYGTADSKLNIMIEGGGTFSLSTESYANEYTEKEVTIPNWGQFTLQVSNNDGKLTITSKYGITSIETMWDASIVTRIAPKIFEMDLSGMNYMPLTKIVTLGVTLKNDFAFNNWDNITNLELSLTDISYANKPQIDIEKLKDNVVISRILFRSLRAVGSIEVLKSPALAEINLFNTKVTGEINTLLDNIHAAGKTSGTLFLYPINNIITDDGNIVSQEYIIEKGGTQGISVTFSQSGYTKTYI